MAYQGQFTGDVQLPITSAILKTNSTGKILAAVAGTDYLTSASLSGYLQLTGGTLTGPLFGTSASFSSYIYITPPSTANLITALLTAGNSDGNFKAGFANGSGTSIASEQAKIGMWYGTTGNPIVHFGLLRGNTDDGLGITFNINNIEKARILNTGNLLVGTTTDSGFRLDVNGTGRFSGQLNIESTSGSIAGARNTLYLKNTASSGNQSNIIVFGSAGTASSWQILNDIIADGTTINQLDILNNGVSRFTIASSGAVTFSSTITSGSISANSGGRTLTFDNITNYGQPLIINAAGSLDLRLQNNGINSLIITSTGAATFSNTLGINGVADSVKGGTYLPSFTGITNFSSGSGYNSTYTRIGDIVTVFFDISVNPTSTYTRTEFYISIPISSAFTNQIGPGSGCMTYGATTIFNGVSISANSTGIIVSFVSPSSSGTCDLRGSFSYKIE